ncbi:MAG: cytidylate kinase [Legionellales bacterium RIFCSPHIGHO2_12_FULL_42_9]|nr:MAG: cytidylate kinase [Legionellales bacterium RIFCSPHIGHO2_12_FULL_42_9]
MKENNAVPVITIDGPSGTGKGTLCYKLANHLHWHALDSGAIYRVLAFAAREKNIAFNKLDQLVTLAGQLNLKFEYDAEPHVMLEGKSITEAIRSEQCAQDASKIAAIPEIRQALLMRQRAFASLPGLVTDGRDMGTVVFPDAIVKIYLDASVEERAKRRYLELKEKGIDVSLPGVVEGLKQRDARDSARSSSPLRPAVDAIHIDTTGLTIAQVFDSVLKLVEIRRLMAEG